MLGIHFPMEYDKTDDMMLLNTLVAPLSLNIDTTLSADVIMNEWELAIDDMKANGTGFLMNLMQVIWNSKQSYMQRNLTNTLS